MKATSIRPIHQHVADVKQKQMETITAMLDWTPEQYCEHQLEEYDNFLNRLFHGFPVAMLEEVKYSPIMAGFWKNEWMIRNERDFLPFAEQMLFDGYEVNQHGVLIRVKPRDTDRAMVYDDYLYIHSHRQLVNNDYFMDQYNRVLGMIREENRRKKTPVLKVLMAILLVFFFASCGKEYTEELEEEMAPEKKELCSGCHRNDRELVTIKFIEDGRTGL